MTLVPDEARQGLLVESISDNDESTGGSSGESSTHAAMQALGFSSAPSPDADAPADQDESTGSSTTGIAKSVEAAPMPQGASLE